MKTDWGTARHKLRPTKIEIKAQVFDVWLEVDDSGIYRCQPNDNFEVDGERPANAKPKRTPVARQPFSVFAESVPADTIAEYGIIIRHKTPGGALRDLSLPASILESDARLWQTLAANGIRVKTSQTARQTVTEYLVEAEPESMIRVYGRPGWHTTPHGLAFVCGQEIIGDPGAMFQPSASAEQATAKTSNRSNLATWQTEIAERATASLVWEFGLCAAFAPAIMELLDFSDDGGFHFYGGTSKGKSIALEVAASVWGAPRATVGIPSYISKWNTTTQSLESAAEGHNCLPLCIDELGEASGAAVHQNLYTLSDGIGRARLKKTGSAQRRRMWRTIWLSSGEVSIEEKIQSAKKRLFGGQAIRCADIWIEDPAIFRHLPDEAAELKAREDHAFGVAGPAFIRALVEDLRDNPDCRADLQAEFLNYSEELIGDDPDSRRHRTARRFALVRLAGQWASDYGILPESVNPTRAVNAVFRAWSQDAGTVALDDCRLAARRLVDWVDSQTGITVIRVDSDNQELEFPRGPRYGWIRDPDKVTDPRTLYIITRALREGLGEYNLRAFARELGDREILRPESAKQYSRKTPKFHAKEELNAITGTTGIPRTYQFDLAKLRAYAENLNPLDFDAADLKRPTVPKTTTQTDLPM